MPELPEVETVRRGLEALTLHQPLVGGEVCLARSLAYPDSPDVFRNNLRGRYFVGWQRRGKYLLGTFDNGAILVVHLRMSGQLLWLATPQPLCSHTRIRWFFPEGMELRFVDQRTFGRCWLLPNFEAIAALIPTLATLGPEPLSEAFSPAFLAAQLHRYRRPLKSALLDQRIVAGMGNIYADESLFLAALHPLTPSDALNPNQVERLHQTVHQVLEAGIAAGGTTLRTFVSTLGVNGRYGGQAWVYGRKGQPCRVCGTPIEQLRIAGRSSHYCPQCQPLSRAMGK
ncbi:DNA-formamidopyrimidine glycosylase [Parathermosynechococcus lividus]